MTPKRHTRATAAGTGRRAVLKVPTTREHLHKGTETVASSHRPSQNDATRSETGCANDPSAGSPTETLLRLLLPLSDKVH